MDCSEWNNFTAMGYLKYALEHYNEVAAAGERNYKYRVLTSEEIALIEGSMMYAFDMKTLKEAYELV